VVSEVRVVLVEVVRVRVVLVEVVRVRAVLVEVVRESLEGVESRAFPGFLELLGFLALAVQQVLGTS
jgi:hypothetical protein